MAGDGNGAQSGAHEDSRILHPAKVGSDGRLLGIPNRIEIDVCLSGVEAE